MMHHLSLLARLVVRGLEIGRRLPPDLVVGRRPHLGVGILCPKKSKKKSNSKNQKRNGRQTETIIASRPHRIVPHPILFEKQTTKSETKTKTIGGRRYKFQKFQT
jgi:hypothetical protein